MVNAGQTGRANGGNAAISVSIREEARKLIDHYLSECALGELRDEELKELTDETINKLKTFKFTNEQISELIYLTIVHTLPKTDLDRLNTSKLFIEFSRISASQGTITSETFMNGFKLVLQNLNNLESEYHFVKSNASLYAARAVCDQIVTFNDLSLLMKHGAYYPLFFLCMQKMHKLKPAEWLRAQLEKSKINLVDMLPSNDRCKERLIQILEDRELSFVYPMLKIEAILFDNVFTQNFDSIQLREWINQNVEVDIRNSTDFIQSLITW